mmetsp:Transcript_59895/g.141718  ORF Transcript_59895/g.141718 Transcript_59895/m.141718 type:complete len:313 (-) Transcript_59895:341-1279(-)
MGTESSEAQRAWCRRCTRSSASRSEASNLSRVDSSFSTLPAQSTLTWLTASALASPCVVVSRVRLSSIATTATGSTDRPSLALRPPLGVGRCTATTPVVVSWFRLAGSESGAGRRREGEAERRLFVATGVGLAWVLRVSDGALGVVERCWGRVLPTRPVGPADPVVLRGCDVGGVAALGRTLAVLEGVGLVAGVVVLAVAVLAVVVSASRLGLSGALELGLSGVAPAPVVAGRRAAIARPTTERKRLPLSCFCCLAASCSLSVRISSMSCSPCSVSSATLCSSFRRASPCRRGSSRSARSSCCCDVRRSTSA